MVRTSKPPEMAPRLATIKKSIENARKYIGASKPAGADKILEALAHKLAGSSKPKAPNQYALFVKAQYKKISAAHPGKSAPEVMKLIAKEWAKK